MHDNDRVEERHRHEKFMVDDDREKPDRLPDNPEEYLESVGDDTRDPDAVLPPAADELIPGEDDLDADAFSEDGADENSRESMRSAEGEDLSAELLSDENEDEDLSNVLRPEDEDETNMQIVSDEGDIPADTIDELIDDERRFITLDERSTELF